MSILAIKCTFLGQNRLNIYNQWWTRKNNVHVSYSILDVSNIYEKSREIVVNWQCLLTVSHHIFLKLLEIILTSMYFLTRSSFCSSLSSLLGSPSFRISIVCFGSNLTFVRRVTARSNALEVSLGEQADNFLKYRKKKY